MRGGGIVLTCAESLMMENKSSSDKINFDIKITSVRNATKLKKVSRNS